ncbi:hypothetical protein OUZ56_002641 [Daphnia magna]|uniref:Uncharacterized protein n=1 Tax=Daphnia magna TaxID=35525 RepID=A0ABR0A6E6_9CRUS|nr:hypothetical protein OUZ56_002641 [Daphnia magna]
MGKKRSDLMRARRNVGILCYSRQKRGDGESKEIKKRDRKESSDMYIQVDIFVSSVAGSASADSELTELRARRQENIYQCKSK